MDHRGFWTLIRSRWLVLVVFTLFGTVAGFSYVTVTEREYTAQAELFVATVGSDNSSDLAQGSTYSQQQARLYSVLATRQEVLAPVISQLELNTTTRELSRRVSASVPLNTSLITIAVSDTSPDRAAATANGVADSLVRAVIRLVPKRSDGTTPVRLNSIQDATAPEQPSAPSSTLAVLGGVMGGLLAGLAFVVLRELASAKVRSADQVIALTGAPILGAIVHDRSAVRTPLLGNASLGLPRPEEYRQLRTNLRFVQAREQTNVVVITSSIPREGRSLTAANLAITMAVSGNTVCLIECDLRRPSLSSYFDLSGDVGLTTILSGDSTPEEAMQNWGDAGLRIITAGPIPANPSELLESEQMLEVIDALRRQFDYVVVDTPPVLPVTDAVIVARAYGGAVLVVGAERIEARELRDAIETLRAAGTEVVGTVLNNVPARLAGRHRNAYATGRASSDRPVTPSTDGGLDEAKQRSTGTPVMRRASTDSDSTPSSTEHGAPPAVEASPESGRPDPLEHPVTDQAIDRQSQRAGADADHAGVSDLDSRPDADAPESGTSRASKAHAVTKPRAGGTRPPAKARG